MKTTFYFIRHGEINRNVSGILPDGIDHPLNEKGKLQAQETAINLSNGFDIALSSPLIRAVETKQIICNTLGCSPVSDIDARLGEVNFGELRGKTWEDLVTLYPDKNLEHEYVNQTYDFTPYNGDSFERVKERLYSFVADMKEKYPGKKILVVTHAGVIRCLYKVEKDHAFIKAPGNASVHEFLF